MFRIRQSLCWLAIAVVSLGSLVQAQENVQRQYDDDDRGYEDEIYEERYDDDDDRYGVDRIIREDRYLEAEVWPDQADGEYYEGDNIDIFYRTNRDAYVAVYSIDTRGRVNLLFPTHRLQNNFVRGGETYRLPGDYDDYDLVVTGPEGREHIQVIASRDPFDIPNWYTGSGIVCTDNNRDYFMDDLNARHFRRNHGQRFAVDRAVIYVNEWEPYYFRPVYYPRYPRWSMCGNVYIDYPFGASVYINGIYWGCAPLYVPRLVVGWHTITVYDRYGHGWESDFHCSRYNTVVLDRRVIRVNQTFVSKYKHVREVGFRDPVKYYPNFKKRSVDYSVKKSPRGDYTVDKSGRDPHVTIDSFTPTRKYSRGTTELVKTTRGFETVGGSNESVYGKGRKSGVLDRNKTSRYGTESSGSGRKRGSTGHAAEPDRTNDQNRAVERRDKRRSGSDGRDAISSKEDSRSGQVERKQERTQSSDNNRQVERKTERPRQESQIERGEQRPRKEPQAEQKVERPRREAQAERKNDRPRQDVRTERSHERPRQEAREGRRDEPKEAQSARESGKRVESSGRENREEAKSAPSRNEAPQKAESPKKADGPKRNDSPKGKKGRS